MRLTSHHCNWNFASILVLIESYKIAKTITNAQRIAGRGDFVREISIFRKMNSPFNSFTTRCYVQSKGEVDLGYPLLGFGKNNFPGRRTKQHRFQVKTCFITLRKNSTHSFVYRVRTNASIWIRLMRSTFPVLLGNCRDCDYRFTYVQLMVIENYRSVEGMQQSHCTDDRYLTQEEIKIKTYFNDKWHTFWFVSACKLRCRSDCVDDSCKCYWDEQLKGECILFFFLWAFEWPKAVHSDDWLCLSAPAWLVRVFWEIMSDASSVYGRV